MARENRPNHILILASDYTLAYRAVRCFSDAGVKVSVAASKAGKRLSLSRYVDKTLPVDDFPPVEEPLIQQTLNDIIARHGIDLLAAGDTPAMRFLIANRNGLNADAFPMPDAQQHGTLNDKGAFRTLCNRLGLRVPEGFICTDKGTIREQIAAKHLTFPVILKPIDLQASQGIVLAHEHDLEAKADEVSYSPILVEQYVAGYDVGLSIFAKDGAVVAAVCHRYDAGVYQVIDNATLYAAVKLILRDLRCSGVFNFDARIGEDGFTYLFECNPRFYHKMCLTRLAGVNLPALGLQTEHGRTAVARSVAYAPKGIALELLSKWRLSRPALTDARFWFKDPLPLAYELLRLNQGF